MSALPAGNSTARFAAGGSLLVVEDDLELGALLESALHDAAGIVAHAPTAAVARSHLASRPWDVVVLDAQLPDGDGFDLCRELRNTVSPPRVLMLTARASEAERIAGLELGADDYVTKPFSLRELLLRVTKLLERQGPVVTEATRITCGQISIELIPRRAFCCGREIALTPLEFDLLAFLARNPGKVFTRNQLLTAIWGSRFEGFEHTVNSHINRLRSKIERDPRRPRQLVTVWGRGYRFAEGHLRGENP